MNEAKPPQIAEKNVARFCAAVQRNILRQKGTEIACLQHKQTDTVRNFR